MNQALETAVQAALDTRVRPLLHSHNGDIELKGIEQDGLVRLRLLGACASCMGAQQTIRDVVVAAIRESCPSVTEVQVETGVSDELAAEALRFLKERRRR
ncbi:MAG: NifU family protein [Syntrophaceae bacterium]